MEEKTLELEVPLLIPGLVNQEDSCLEKLENALQNQKGILRAHVDRHFPGTMLLAEDESGRRAFRFASSSPARRSSRTSRRGSA